MNVVVGDTAYSAVTFLYQAAEHADPVEVVRVRGNRVFTDNSAPGKGCPIWFGIKSASGDSETYRTPDETVSVTFTTGKGRLCDVSITAWRDMQMRGKKISRCISTLSPFSALR
ncbi:hypothetical protein QUF90_23850 [Desulfococcaceae bacterium HSG9]|nr:hypothetical protein [Desulfococcaceae bacterium HSG9]